MGSSKPTSDEINNAIELGGKLESLYRDLQNSNSIIGDLLGRSRRSSEMPDERTARVLEIRGMAEECMKEAQQLSRDYTTYKGVQDYLKSMSVTLDKIREKTKDEETIDEAINALPVYG